MAPSITISIDLDSEVKTQDRKVYITTSKVAGFWSRTSNGTIDYGKGSIVLYKVGNDFYFKEEQWNNLFQNHDKRSEASTSTSTSAMAWMFTKVLTTSDIKERRVYLPAELAERFGVPNGTEVSVCDDAQMNNACQMNCITRDGKSYLGSEWGNFYDLGHLGANRERFFKIERRGAGFDLNEPPSDN